ncbi:hypothetical protein J6590_073941 [Homalodisca vitripennis]|nr:hypothetical protein J6590_073941 [Homalodisca vitripennis]
MCVIQTKVSASRPTCACSGVCPSGSEDLIKQNKWESRYSKRSMGLIKSGSLTNKIRTYAITNTDSTSNVLDHSACSEFIRNGRHC